MSDPQTFIKAARQPGAHLRMSVATWRDMARHAGRAAEFSAVHAEFPTKLYGIPVVMDDSIAFGHIIVGRSVDKPDPQRVIRRIGSPEPVQRRIYSSGTDTNVR